MVDEVLPAFLQFGAVGLWIWWLTQKLIPVIHQDRIAQLEAFERRVDRLQSMFQQEMQYLREANKDAIEQMITRIDHRFDDMKTFCGK